MVDVTSITGLINALAGYNKTFWRVRENFSNIVTNSKSKNKRKRFSTWHKTVLNLLIRNGNNKLAHRKNGTDKALSWGYFSRNIYRYTERFIVYHFHFIFCINYHVALIGMPFTRQITRSDKRPRSLICSLARSFALATVCFRKYFPI